MAVDFKNTCPKTLDEAIMAIVTELSPSEICASDDGTALANPFSLGTRIRNNWGLWTGSALKTHFQEQHGLGHADDMSYLILMGVEAHLQHRPFKVEAHVKRCKDRWENMMMDPLTLCKREAKASPDNVEIPS